MDRYAQTYEQGCAVLGNEAVSANIRMFPERRAPNLSIMRTAPVAATYPQ